MDTTIESELRRLNLIPTDGQHGYGQPLWATGADEGRTWISDGQQTETVDAASLAAGLSELAPGENDLFDRVWDAIAEAKVD